MNMIERPRDQEIKGSRGRGFRGKLTLRSILLAFSLVALAVTQAARAGGENANVFYVDDANGSDSNSGQTPDQALKTIKAALIGFTLTNL